MGLMQMWNFYAWLLADIDYFRPAFGGGFGHWSGNWYFASGLVVRK